MINWPFHLVIFFSRNEVFFSWAILHLVNEILLQKRWNLSLLIQYIKCLFFMDSVLTNHLTKVVMIMQGSYPYFLWPQILTLFHVASWKELRNSRIILMKWHLRIPNAINYFVFGNTPLSCSGIETTKRMKLSL